ncbi:MAG: TlpA disulfide reductase family protein [Terriglobales bacterium]|jgi:cytochrome c biogenesis protein CcmG/thiol:disulfide interchange protein DsbE
MAALPAGTKAPDFSLPGLDGSTFSLKDALQRGPVVAAFFKISCPVCQYTFPFVERLKKAYGGRVAIVGISQDDRASTAAFLKEYGVSFPALLDNPAGYAVSNAYGLTNVPTWFFIAPDGEIKISSVGWVRADMEELNRHLADAGKIPVTQLFLPKDDVRDYRPG